MQNLNINTKAIVMALIAFLCFNIGDATLKSTYEFYSPTFAATIAIGFETLLLVLIAPFFGGFKKLYQTSQLKLQIYRGLIGTAFWLLFILALKHVDLATNYALILSGSFWVAIIGFFIFKERIGWHRWCTIAVAFIGVIIVLKPGVDSFQITSLISIAAAIVWAGLAITTRMLGDKETLLSLCFIALAINLLITVPFTYLTGVWQPIALEHLIYFIPAGAAYLTGFLLFSKAFAVGESSAVAPTQYSQIIWGSLIGYFVFKQIPDITTFIGGFIIVACGIFLVYRENKKIT